MAENIQTKYMDELSAESLVQNIKDKFSPITHKHTASEVGADPSGSASTALSSAKSHAEGLVADIQAAIDSSKVDIEQGEENAGKILAIDETGSVVPTLAPEVMDVTYYEDDDGKVLEFISKEQLPGNVGIDSSLTLNGHAADAKAVGDAINELAEKIESLLSS